MKNALAWSTLGSFFNKIFSIIIFILLAQKLPPSDFGIIAIIMIILAFIKVFTESGYKEAIIFFKINDKEQLSSIFYLIFFISAIFFILLYIFKKNISFFLMEGIDTYIVYISVILLISPWKVIGLAELEKEMKFKKIIFIEFFSVFVSSLVALFMAYENYGIISLIFMYLINEIIQVVLCYLFSSWKLSLKFSFNSIKYIYNYSIHLIIFNFINFITENIDKVLISKYMGKSDVGIYSRTQQLTVMPAVFVSQSLSRVFFPYLSSIKEKTKDVQSFHLTSLRIISFFGFPFISLFFIFSNEIVFILLSDEWKDAIPLLELFAVIGMFRVLGFLSLNIYKSLGHTYLQSKINIFLKINLLIATIIGINFGLLGLVYSLLIVRIINLILTQYFISNILNINMKKILLNISSILIYIFIISLCCKGSILYLDIKIESISFLILVSIVYIFIYFLIGLLLFRDIQVFINNYLRRIK